MNQCNFKRNNGTNSDGGGLFIYNFNLIDLINIIFDSNKAG
jgi:hypothetical protein